MSAVIRKFNWADATDSDDDCSPRSTGGVNSTTAPSTPARQKVVATVPTSTRTNGGGLSEDDEQQNTATNSPALGAARELNFNNNGGNGFDAMTPLRHCQEITIQAAIPYKLKSVWNGSAGNTPIVPSASAIAASYMKLNAAANATNNAMFSSASNGTSAASTPAMTPAPTPAARHAEKQSPPTPLLTSAAAVSAAVAVSPLPSSSSAVVVKPLRMNRALEELTNVLRAAKDASLPYDELMLRSKWRSRFQPSFGSLFTFIKRNREIFRYKQSVVELVQEASIVTELLKLGGAGVWGVVVAAGATSTSAADAAAAASTNVVASENTPMRR